MTDKQQPEALLLADASSAMADEGEMIHLLSWHEIRNLLRANAVELRRLHAESEMRRAALLDEMRKAARLGAELETMRAKLKTYEDLGDAGSDVQLLRTGYAAARLEIESLRDEVKEYRHAAGVQKTLIATLLAEKPAGAQQPGAAYGALPVTPQFPAHPEPMVMDWSAIEISVIAQYGRDMYEAGKRASHGQAPASKIEGLTAAQESLGVEFEKVLHDNLFDLYEESAPHGQAPAQAAPAAVAGPSEWCAGVEAVAKMLSKKANDFALEHGCDDMGGLSFGSGAHAEAKMDWHSGLLELEEEARAMLGRVFPMTGDEEESDLGDWQDGAAKPTQDGTYLREFDEGLGTSEFHQGKWLRDGFFQSDIQDARWRGRAAPTTQPAPVAPGESLCNDPRLCCRSHPHEDQSLHCQLREVAAWLRWLASMGRVPSAESMLDRAEKIDSVALAIAAPAALDAARWHWLSEHIQVAWNEGKFTSLVRIVSEQHRQSLNASVDRMMAGDWSDADAARAAQEGK